MKRNEFIYRFVSAFLEGRKGVMWCGEIDVDWIYWAMRNLCAISKFKMTDFNWRDKCVMLKEAYEQE